MQFINDLDDISKPFKNAVITIGNFDGVHIGHQVLLGRAAEKAGAMDGLSLAMTFEPHPARVLGQNNHPPLITLYEQKAELIERSGIDVLITIPFTREFATITAKQFVGDLLVGKIGIKAIVIGQDYTFGKNREGNAALLKFFSKSFGFEVIVIDWIPASDRIHGRISSTKIRELLMEGNVSEARKLLGRFYQIKGTVVSGQGRGGKVLGFQTANINLQDELCPKTGIYAVTVECDDKKYEGVANIGYSPTFDDHIFTVEVHILDFNKNIYGQKIRVNFIQRIRDEIKFSNIPALSKQIEKDVKEAHNILS
ncbi:MAG: bifunctional riboflavin kinase/FAD synthetase [Desulfobacterales bacterium]|nr:bifunctional riboflavin kinase/FAD synthetase [Desulfobacterales bacterium]